LFRSEKAHPRARSDGAGVSVFRQALEKAVDDGGGFAVNIF